MTDIVGYTIVDDFGVTVNPILLAGQVHGGVVQGIGQALTEDTVYGEDGQLLTASFMDYAVPRADNFPFFHFETRNVPSTTNATGHQGRRRGRHDRRDAGRAQRRDRRALARLRHRPYRDAGDAGAHLGGDPGSVAGVTAEKSGRAEAASDHPVGHSTLRASRSRSFRWRSSSACRPASRRQARCRPARSSSSAPSSPSFRSSSSWPSGESSAPRFTTKRPFNHIARGVVGVGAMGLGFFALTRLPLPEAITLNYAQPLLVVVFSSIFLGEAIRVYRWSAVAVGLVGVLIISWPELTLLAFGRRTRRPGGARRHRGAGRRGHLGRRHAAGAQPRPDREDGDHRAVVLADGERHGAVVAAVRLAGADAAQAALLVAAGFCGGLGADPDDGGLPPCRGFGRWRRSNTPR